MKFIKSILPPELIQFIFSFDNTFQKYFSTHVLPYLTKRRLFQVLPKTLSRMSFNNTQKKLYLMIDEDYAKIMNSLTNPTFCSTIFFSKHQPKSEYLDLFHLVTLLQHPPYTPVHFFSETMSWEAFCNEL